MSPGTVAALALTVLVVIGLGLVIPRLTGDIRLQGSQGAIVLTADGIPVMEVRDIPLSSASPGPTPTASPAPTRAAAAVTAASTAAASPKRTPRPVVTASPSPTPMTERRLRLVFAGTAALEGDVRQSGYYQEAKAYDFSEILSALRTDLTADISLVTLENLIFPARKVSDLIAPAQVMPMLSGAGFNTVALGFPKAYQYGADAVTETLSAAEIAGLRAVGLCGAEEDWPPALLETGGVRTALLHYTDSVDKTGKNLMKKAGTAWALPLAEQAERDIRAAKTAGAELVIVSLRWGTPGKTKPTAKQEALAQSLADAGADLIVGSGSRRVQQITWLTAADGRRTLCAYSLGSLLEDSRDSGAVEGILLSLTACVRADGTVSLEEAEALPTFTWRFRQEGGYRFRVIRADREAPDGMDSTARAAMEKALGRLRKTLADSAVRIPDGP